MISDLDLVNLCQATYSSPATLKEPSSGVYCCSTDTPYGKVYAFRGSITRQDWERDGETLPRKSRLHPQLGYCHDGFLTAAESIVAEVAADAGDAPVILTGHSLGGAEAVGVAALMVLLGKTPAKVTTFGAPRFGMFTFVRVVNKITTVRQYRRGNDPVPDVPFFLPFLFRYRISRSPLIPIGKPQLDAFSAHHIEGYVADMQDQTT